MMDTSIAAIISILFALLLAALIAALICSREFRDAVLGGPGEAKILNLISIKGVAIVLLCGLLIGGLLFSLERLPKKVVNRGPITIRLNVHFEPDEVNPNNPQFAVKAFLKTRNGIEPVKVIDTVREGSLSVRLDVPDMETPFFLVFETPRGTWKTDDYSIHETAATARKQQLP